MDPSPGEGAGHLGYGRSPWTGSEPHADVARAPQPASAAFPTTPSENNLPGSSHRFHRGRFFDCLASRVLRRAIRPSAFLSAQCAPSAWPGSGRAGMLFGVSSCCLPAGPASFVAWMSSRGLVNWHPPLPIACSFRTHRPLCQSLLPRGSIRPPVQASSFSAHLHFRLVCHSHARMPLGGVLVSGSRGHETS